MAAEAVVATAAGEICYNPVMTISAEPRIERNQLLDQQHIVLDDVSWSFYERVLEELGNRPTRVTYFRGRIEIMAPLAEHESSKRYIGSLIDILTVELNIATARFGSTTFRREDAQVGLEPDECYYFQNAGRVRGMKRFDPAIHPAPDLAIEVDITSRSIAREPIYADLRVPELWRYDGFHIAVLFLEPSGGKYRASATSRAFPFLSMDKFEAFVHRMEQEEQTAVLREFQTWARTLKTK